MPTTHDRRTVTAINKVRQIVVDARGAGFTWVDVADALGLDGEDQVRAELAYIRVTPAGPHGLTTLWFCCCDCQVIVTDHGPYCEDPDSNETGHASTCPRQRAERAAYRADNGR